jgi:hypothetical protein
VMPARFKLSAWLGVGLALLFYLFFQVSKQQPDLANANVFADDPYDAVGSFAVQLALFVSVVSLIRALRRYSPSVALEPQKRLVARGLAITCLAVAITLVADAIAMIRQPSVWTGSSAGHVLAALLGLMAVLTLLAAWLVHAWTRTSSPAPLPEVPLVAALAILAGSVVVLALYPESWRQSTPGALLTVVAGAILLLVPLWALGLALSPSPGPQYRDVLDDLESMYRYLKVRSRRFDQVAILAERVLGWRPVRAVLRWLNPRWHRWNAPILTGTVLGIALVLGEMLGEGGAPHQIGRLAFVIAVFVSLELFAVLLGYALLSLPLGLFRQGDTSISPSSASSSPAGTILK